MKNAAVIAEAEINAQGGSARRPVEITYADTRGMPAEGRTAAERLVQQNKVVAVFGEFHSPVALAGMEVYHNTARPSWPATCGPIRSPQRDTRRCSATHLPCR